MEKANVEKIEPDRPYAEFWMRTHDSEPSFMAYDNGEGGNLGLRDWILKNPNVLGHKVLKKWGPDLPFLFKAHPDKELAKELYKLKRNIYKDANHKPEMALAITKFRALCGFITFEVIHESCSFFGGETSLSWLSSSKKSSKNDQQTEGGSIETTVSSGHLHETSHKGYDVPSAATDDLKSENQGDADGSGNSGEDENDVQNGRPLSHGTRALMCDEEDTMFMEVKSPNLLTNHS
ncbi:mannose-6-phosphate isomerase-like [Hibiscus syriacus]|uniref:mannose-6-phosphate isomerase-like n=1 Tax=Hibiscus syriacus TaxID=106335 RepID=UPI0019218972|nr:mannose-6-phosphate isomerase-like [Hibiscus syriacus]